MIVAMGNLTMIYGVLALLSALLAVGYLLWDKKKPRTFLALFGCVTAVDCGYFLLAVCQTLEGARVANAISYFGTAFSVLVMIWIISEVCQIKLSAPVRICSLVITGMIFLLAASGDWLGLYYRSVSIQTVDGMTKLIKDYGPLHIVYTLYLVASLLVMATMILYANRTKRLGSTKYAVFLFLCVLLNFGVWAVEQVIAEEFELLAVSYIVTAVMLYAIHGILSDYGILRKDSSVISVHMLAQLNAEAAKGNKLPPNMETMFQAFIRKVDTLSSAERRIFDYYVNGYEAAAIPELAFISIHTVKKHNHSIYQKLEISSMDELLLYIELFRCCGRLEELQGQGFEIE